MSLKAQPSRAAHNRSGAIASYHQRRMHLRARQLQNSAGIIKRNRFNSRARKQRDPLFPLDRRVQHRRQQARFNHVAQHGLGAVLGNERDAADPPLSLDLHHRFSAGEQSLLQSKRPEDPPATVRDEKSPAVDGAAPGRRRAGVSHHRLIPAGGERQGQRQANGPSPGNSDVTTMEFRIGHGADISPPGPKEKGARH